MDTYFSIPTKLAKELIQAEQSGKPIPAGKFDFGVDAVCAGCREYIMPPKKISRCSACKAIIYCSVQCANRYWSCPHKPFCLHNKRHMQRLPVTQAVLKSFPWGRLETDGTFDFKIARGRFSVLGGSGYGYWSHRGGTSPHAIEGIDDGSSSAPYAQDMQKSRKYPDHLDGYDLLKSDHLSDKQGWKLSPKFVPYRDFSKNEERQPLLVTKFDGGIVDWDSWYRWRKIPKDSPAALLMHYPMSVYQMLVHCLKVTSPSAGRESNRVNLNVHLLGVEVELNFVPLFSELALLLPFHDIQMTLVGPGAQQLLDKAKNHPSSIAIKCFSSPPSPIFTYSAPPECGSSTISIYLSTSTMWEPATLPTPDALIACNAGLISYRGWSLVISTALFMRLPFASTEYMEQSAEDQRNYVLRMLKAGGREPPNDPAVDHPIELNPFHCPGQRAIPMFRLPNLFNGFTLVVHKTPEGGRKANNDELYGAMKGLFSGLLDLDALR
ncbi:hypothetical protein BDP27DRAFT_1298363 [Rhodocollybia butyracea]|uniref:MYND-type domain-containing protein n=1 Tax=Rhodocollybia butyracea TaxID=206335 RepID=A0A9P5U442_9AGAR|nr:hypothetical protein BDP27DRAFT_1298363 [Rhodocollybia butyracea]